MERETEREYRAHDEDRDETATTWHQSDSPLCGDRCTYILHVLTLIDNIPGETGIIRS
jgi:hypothetical protein